MSVLPSLLRSTILHNSKPKPVSIFRNLARHRTYATSVFDKKSIQFTSKHIKQALNQKDIVFYQAPAGAKRTFTFMYISAGVQLLFWGNLGSLAYVSYTKQESEDGPYVLAPQGQRMAIAGGLVAVGVAIATVMCIYPWRYIDKVVLLKGAEQVRLITHARVFQSHKIREYPIERLYCKQKLFTGVGKTGTEPVGTKANSSHIFLNAEGEKIAYMLDRKGQFMDTKLFDGLWYSPHAK
ncbi:hypothetical protein K501DRAFT_249412 [Backusella circina FSU 941]|nr:hypothetical protein K501DRAFT_249412 [Backusella circina FSU 941]